MRNSYFLVMSRIRLKRLYYSKRKESFVFGIGTLDYPDVARFFFCKYLLSKSFFESVYNYLRIKSGLRKLKRKGDLAYSVIVKSTDGSIVAIGSLVNDDEFSILRTGYIDFENSSFSNSLWLDIKDFKFKNLSNIQFN